MSEPFQNRRKTVSALKAIWGVLAALLVAALLSSGSLVSLAERQEFGTTRDIALPIARGFDRFSSFLSLDRPANALDSALNEDETTFDVESLIAIGQTQTTAPSEAVDQPSASPEQPDAPVETLSTTQPETSEPLATDPPSTGPTTTEPPTTQTPTPQTLPQQHRPQPQQQNLQPQQHNRQPPQHNRQPQQRQLQAGRPFPKTAGKPRKTIL